MVVVLVVVVGTTVNDVGNGIKSVNVICIDNIRNFIHTLHRESSRKKLDGERRWRVMT